MRVNPKTLFFEGLTEQDARLLQVTAHAVAHHYEGPFPEFVHDWLRSATPKHLSGIDLLRDGTFVGFAERSLTAYQTGLKYSGLCSAIVDALIRNLSAQEGLRCEWDALDGSVKEEIRSKWGQTVREHVAEWVL